MHTHTHHNLILVSFKLLIAKWMTYHFRDVTQHHLDFGSRFSDNALSTVWDYRSAMPARALKISYSNPSPQGRALETRLLYF